MEIFQYDSVPLDRDKDSIRLLELVGDDSENLECRIICHSLADEPEYMALSYTWGEVVEMHTIRMNGYKVQVRHNLWEFLTEAVRRRLRSRLWIDALSIDQHSISEKNNQVALMGSIFQKAKVVIVWLGLLSDDSDLAIDAMKRFVKDNSVYKDMNVDPSEVKKPFADIARPYPQDGAKAIKNLFHRHYWYRVWAIQEYVLADARQIWIGEATILGELIDTFFDLVLPLEWPSNVAEQFAAPGVQTVRLAANFRHIGYIYETLQDLILRH